MDRSVPPRGATGVSRWVHSAHVQRGDRDAFGPRARGVRGGSRRCPRRGADAAVHASDLASPLLDARWLLRLSRSGAPFPTDVAPEAHEAALEAVRAAPQFR